MRKIVIICAIALAYSFINKGANAATRTWTGSTSSNWATASNWSENAVPAAGDVVQIGLVTFTNQPVISSAAAYTSITTGSVKAVTLTINAAVTVSGAITLATGTTIISNASGSIGAASMAITASTLTLNGALNLTGALSNSGISTVTCNNGSNTIKGITVNSSGDLTFGGSGTTSITTNTTNINNPGKLTIGTGNKVNFTAQIYVSNSSFLVNNGTLTTNSQISVIANPSSFTNGSTGTLKLNSTTLSMGGGSTFNNQGTITATSSTISLGGNPVTGTNSGTINLTSSSTLTLAAGTYINNSGTISGTSSAINLSGNPAYIANSSGSTFSVTSTPVTLAAGTYISNTGSTFTAASSNISLTGNPSYILNQNSGTTSSNATLTSSTVSMVAGAYITNTGSNLTATSCPFIMNGNTTILTNQNSGSNTGTFIIDGATVSMVPGSSINNYGTFRIRNGCEVTMSGNTAVVRNYSTGNFYLDASTINFNDYTYIDNGGTFTASNNSFIKSNTSGRDLKINNTGTFYAGTTLSPCVITLGGNANAEKITNQSGAFFYIASTSVVAPTGVNSIISNAGTFTIRSDANGSGTIATLGASAAVTGIYNVERYITGGAAEYRGYRLLSSPVYQGTVSSVRLYNFDYIKNGTIVTGTTGTAGGFDSSPLNNPTIYLYREDVVPVPNSFTSGNFKGVNKINNSYIIQVDGYNNQDFALPVGNGFMFFFRGDRTTNTVNKTTPPFVNPESVIMTTTGTINQGQVTYRNWATTSSTNLLYTTATANSAVRGFNLVGNPYPSSINWNTMNSTTAGSGIYAPNVSNSIWIYNSTAKTYGVYVKGDPTGTNGSSNVIPSGQGFYVRANNASAQVVFYEDCKVNTQVTGSKLLMSLPVETEKISRYFRISFEKDSLNKEDALVFFNKGAKPEFADGEDGQYLKGNNSVILSTISADNVPLAVNHTAFSKRTQIISLNTNTTLNGRYTLNLNEIKNIPQLYDVWLKDAYKKDSLDMKNNPKYVFDIFKSDSATFSKRFTVVIRQNPGFAYRLLSFSGTKTSEGARLTWKTQNEFNYTYFELERSADGGKTFKNITRMNATGQGNYSFIDRSPGIGEIKYRLKQEDINGDITYSNLVPLMYADVSQNIAHNTELNLYPNPAVEKISVKINQPNTTHSSYTINMLNTNGSLVKTYISGSTDSEANISTLQPGIYFIQVLDDKGKNIVGKSKFVKL